MRVKTNIRFLDSGDLPAYRELRLAGLKDSPAAFGSSYVNEVDLPLADFAARLRPHGRPENGIFGAFLVDGRLAGILGFIREHRIKRVHIASLWGMIVSTDFRGRGIGVALLEHAISYAQKLDGVRQILISVTAGNVAASRLYYSRGFERYGLERDALCLDGTYFDEEHLALFFNTEQKHGRRAPNPVP